MKVPDEAVMPWCRRRRLRRHNPLGRYRQLRQVYRSYRIGAAEAVHECPARVEDRDLHGAGEARRKRIIDDRAGGSPVRLKYARRSSSPFPAGGFGASGSSFGIGVPVNAGAFNR